VRRRGRIDSSVPRIKCSIASIDCPGAPTDHRIVYIDRASHPSHIGSHASNTSSHASNVHPMRHEFRPMPAARDVFAREA